MPDPIDSSDPSQYAVGVDALRSRLDQLALGGGTWADLVRVIARDARCPVRLVALDGALLAQAGMDGPSGDAEVRSFDGPRPRVVAVDQARAAFEAGGPVTVTPNDGPPMRARPIVLGDRRVALVLAGGHDDQLADRITGAAVVAMGIVAVRRDAVAEAVAENAAWFIDELRHGWRRSSEELVAEGKRFALRLDEPHAAVALAYHGGDTRMWRTALSWLETPVRATDTRAWTVIADGGQTPLRERIERMAARLADVVASGDVVAAVGPVGVGVAPTGEGFTLAELAMVLKPPSPTRVVVFDDLGAAGLLARVPELELRRFAAAVLGPLLGRTDLLGTLRAWIDSGGSRASVADTVGIHRNSVGHRVQRIAELTASDLSDATQVLRFHSALTALDVADAKRRIGDTPNHSVVLRAHPTSLDATLGHDATTG